MSDGTAGQVGRLRMFRTATHPEFIAYEIEPVLVELGLPVSLARTVGELMDVRGCTARAAASDLMAIITAYS